MKILIFGGNGFLGRSVVSNLEHQGFECHVASRNSNNENYKINISVFEEFFALPTNFFHVIINCATILPGGDYLDNDYLDKIYKTNILGAQNICKWINGQTSVKKIINCSSLAVVDKPWPLNFDENASTYPVGSHVLYSATKLIQELIFKTFSTSNNISLVQLRFSALYGKTMSWDGVMCNLIDKAKYNKKISLTNASKVTVDFLNVDDASKIILACIETDTIGILNCASGQEVSILELARIIADKFLYAVEIDNSEDRNFTENRALISIEKLKKIIDPSNFISLSDGINKLLTS